MNLRRSPFFRAVRPLLGGLPRRLNNLRLGLAEDARSLPGRLSDPSRLFEPLSVVHHVGGGDFRAMGVAIMQLLEEHGGLRPNARVLDIGCGTGRVAVPLARHLSTEGRYVGFDITRRAVTSARWSVGRRRPDFAFIHADVLNAAYNPQGRVAEREYRFPAEDGSMTLAFATSVFSHMRIESIGWYLKEISRVLAPGGRAVFTAYLLDDASSEAISSGASGMAFQPWRGSSMTLDPAVPEGALAHPAAAVLGAGADAGLRTVAVLEGGWRGRPGTGWQDLVVLEKPGD